METVNEVAETLMGKNEEADKAALSNKNRGCKVAAERPEPQHLCLMYPEEVLNITLKTSAETRCVRCVHLCAA